MNQEFIANDFVDYRHFVSSWSWQWIATLTFKNPVPRIQAMRMLKRYIIKFGIKHKIQLGYIGSLSYDSIHPHIHLLMIGRNKHGQTLYDLPNKEAETMWQHGRAEI